MTAPFRTATPARLASVAAALAILATVLIRPALAPAGARAMGPLPDCRYDDILTTPRGYADWSITLVDTILRVPKGYVPPDLVAATEARITGGGTVRAVMIDDLRAMTEAAAAAGNGIGIQSAYRSYASQEALFAGWVTQFGYARALEVPARPGHSEHQLGLAIDFRSEPDGSPFTGTWGSTPAGKWMRTHAWEYGFALSYPKDTVTLTCYAYEPWHFRYVGRDLAALIHTSGLTPRQYLWANFTTTVVPPPPPPAKAAVKTATPTAKPSPTTTVEPSPSAVPTLPPTPSPAPSATAAPVTSDPTPVQTTAPDPVQQTANVDAAAVVGLALLLVGVIGGGASLARRRGRSGVGL